MNTKATAQKLNQLRLKAMASHYEQVTAMPIHQQPGTHQLIAELADKEFDHRQNRKTELLLIASKLRIRSNINQISYEPERNLKQEHLLHLSSGNYIDKSENILITGATGCGKTYIACALGVQACLQTNTVLYTNMNKLIEKIAMSKLDGSYNVFFKKLASVKLLILDDFGLAPLQYETKLALLQIIEERHEMKSTIIVAQIPIANWYDYLNEPTIADAILDRLTAKAHRIELKGSSKRLKINV